MDSSPVIEYRNKMLDWQHLLSQNPQQYQACYAPQSGSGLDIDVNSEESNQADQCRYPRPERRYSLCRNRGTVSPKYSDRMLQTATFNGHQGHIIRPDRDIPGH